MTSFGGKVMFKFIARRFEATKHKIGRFFADLTGAEDDYCQSRATQRALRNIIETDDGDIAAWRQATIGKA